MLALWLLGNLEPVCGGRGVGCVSMCVWGVSVCVGVICVHLCVNVHKSQFRSVYFLQSVLGRALRVHYTQKYA